MIEANSKIVVSICCLAYNHAPYIRQCLEGFVMQKCDFAFEVLVHDDASTDKTAEIIKEYQNKYPGIIKPIYQTENKYSKGVKVTTELQFPRAKGKYIAICEGDDYWTDPYKLQKQVDFLEANPDFVLTSSNAKIIDFEGNLIKENKLDIFENTIYSKDDLKNGAFLLTLTLCFRNKLIKEFPKEFYKVKNSDIFLISILGKYGKGYFSTDIKHSVYRVHSGGVHSSSSTINKMLDAIKTLYYIRKYHKRTDKKFSLKKMNNIIDNNFKNLFMTKLRNINNKDVSFKKIILLYFKLGTYKRFYFVRYAINKLKKPSTNIC